MPTEPGKRNVLDMEMPDNVRLKLAARFIQQVIAGENADALQAFIDLRDDPRLASILDIATSLDDERIDQLLFAAEDLYSEMVGRSGASA